MHIIGAFATTYIGGLDVSQADGGLDKMQGAFLKGDCVQGFNGTNGLNAINKTMGRACSCSRSSSSTIAVTFAKASFAWFIRVYSIGIWRAVKAIGGIK